MFSKAVRVGTYLWTFSVYCETDEETKKDRLPKDERITIPGVETKTSGEIRSQDESLQDQLTTTARSRNNNNNNRSDYDNVASMQPQQQHRNVSNLVKTSGGHHISTGRGYEEANV